MDLEQQVTATRLWSAVVNIDLQLYKGSVYRLRWGSPGGIDAAIPAYEEGARTLAETAWPEDMSATADGLRARIEAYVEALRVQDITSASLQHSRMVAAFESLRDQVRAWPFQ